jgi:hypothetical protein
MDEEKIYTISEQGIDIVNRNIQQLTDLVNILNTAMSAEGKMIKGFLIQIVTNLNAVKPMIKKEEKR